MFAKARSESVDPAVIKATFDQYLLQDSDINKLAVDFSIIKHNEYKAMNHRSSLNASKT